LPETGDPNDAATPDAQILAGQGKSALHRALVILGPLGLAIDIFLSLWVSHLHVTHSVSVQVEPEWVVGEQLAVRTLLVDHYNEAYEGVAVEMKYRGVDGEAVDLGELQPVEGGVSQGTLTVPSVALGEGELELDFTPPAELEVGRIVERVPVMITDARKAKEAEISIAGSMLQWADDTEDQPESLRIDLRPHGRILAGFRNTFVVRVTDPKGVPHAGDVEIRLVSGEFAAKKGKEADPPVLHSGPLDPLGMVSLSGDLTSDVVRFEVRVLPASPAQAGSTSGSDAGPDPAQGAGTPGEPPASPPMVAEPISRKFRLVSFAGGVRIDSGTSAVRPGDTLELRGTALSARRPIFIDVHGPDGAWVDTVSPPLTVASDPREWTMPATWDSGGLMQFEAYHFTTSPDESSAVVRVLISAESGKTRDSLAPLIRRQRELLDSPRVERDFDVARERRFLEHIESAELSPEDVQMARSWLIGSLPVEVHGPPFAINTRSREDESMKDRKTGWILGLRWFLLGGGTLFLLVMGWSLWQTNQQMGRATAEALGIDEGGEAGEGSAQGEHGEEAGVELVGQLVQAKRQFAVRGLVVIAFMTAALLLTVGLLESLVWVV
jgi:hypothetical protein